MIFQVNISESDLIFHQFSQKMTTEYVAKVGFTAVAQANNHTPKI